MSRTRQPQLNPAQLDPVQQPQGAGLDPRSWLSALGNQAMQSLLPVGRSEREEPSESALPALAWGDLWRDNFGGGEAPDPQSFGAAGASGPAADYRASSPLLDQLMRIDPTDPLSLVGLTDEQGAAVRDLITNRSARTWTQVAEQLGPEVSKILMGSAANRLIDQNMDENGLTTLYLESLDPAARNNPSTDLIQKALTDNLGGAVTKVSNPTLEEMSALFQTNRVRDAVLTGHGVPGHLQARVGDSWDFKFQDPKDLIQSMGDSKNLRSVLLNTCYGATGGNNSLFRRIADKSLAVMGSEPILYGAGANKITQAAYEKIGQGMAPDQAFRETSNAFNRVENKDLEWQMQGAQSHWDVDQGRAARGSLESPEVSSAVQKIFGDKKFFGINPIAQYGGSKASRTPIPMRPSGPSNKASPTSPVDAPATDTTRAPPGADAHLGADAELTSGGTAPKLPKFNLLEDGLNGLGLVGGLKDVWEGGGDLLGAFQGTTDARTGTIGGASLFSGAVDTAQNALAIAEKVPQLAPTLARSPLLKAFANNKAVGMLSALPSVAGYGYDMLTGAADHQKALSGGDAVQGVASAAASTFGGPWGMVASLGTALGEGVFNNFVAHDENTPTSLGQLGGMIDYSVDQVGLPRFMQDTIQEMAFDSRLEDPSVDRSSKDWAYASASMARLYLMADQGVHDLFGAGDSSMLHRIAEVQAATAQEATPSTALLGGD